MKHLIVVDMQNDFCTGTLANKDAVAIIPKIAELLEKAKADGDNIIFTQDTHYEDYLETGEGKHLPVKHCIQGTEGWEIVPDLKKLAPEDATFIAKNHFGFDNWAKYIKPGDEVTIVGTVTSICVLSNAVILKTIENVEVTVVENACADLTKTRHNAALEAMTSCQCNIVQL